MRREAIGGPALRAKKQREKMGARGSAVDLRQGGCVCYSVRSRCVRSPSRLARRVGAGRLSWGQKLFAGTAALGCKRADIFRSPSDRADEDQTGKQGRVALRLRNNWDAAEGNDLACVIDACSFG